MRRLQQLPIFYWRALAVLHESSPRAPRAAEIRNMRSIVIPGKLSIASATEFRNCQRRLDHLRCTGMAARTWINLFVGLSGIRTLVSISDAMPFFDGHIGSALSRLDQVFDAVPQVIIEVLEGFARLGEVAGLQGGRYFAQACAHDAQPCHLIGHGERIERRHRRSIRATVSSNFTSIAWASASSGATFGLEASSALVIRAWNSCSRLSYMGLLRTLT